MKTEVKSRAKYTVFLVASCFHCIVSAANISSVISIGDSLLDCGNNNNLSVALSIARADHTPYGIAFDTSLPTGRFTDGRTLSDLMAAKLGISLALAYFDPNAAGTNLLQGINIASGGAGILDTTSSILTPHNLTEQIGTWLPSYKQKLANVVGAANASLQIANALFLISVGSNDISYKSLNPQTAFLDDSQFQSLLLEELSSRLQTIYSMGGRKFAIQALGPLGCTPISLTLQCLNFPVNLSCDRTVCNEHSNQVAYNLNLGIQGMLNNLVNNLTAATFYFDPTDYNVTLNAIKNPSSYGLTTSNTGCCGTGLFEIGDLCYALLPRCSNTSEFLFFDAVHPGTEFTKVIANRLAARIM